MVELAKRAASGSKPREMKEFQRDQPGGPVQRSLEKYTDGPVDPEPEDLGDVDEPEEDDDDVTGAGAYVSRHTSPETKARLLAAAQKAKDFYKYEVAPRVEKLERSDLSDRIITSYPKQVATAAVPKAEYEEAEGRLKLRSMTPAQRESQRLDGRIKELEAIRERAKEMAREKEDEELRDRLSKRGF